MESEGHCIPVLQTRPELFQDAVQYLSAFQELSSSRHSSFGVGYIPYSEICSYLTENHIFDLNERVEYHRWIRYIDSVYVSLQNKKSG